MTKEELKALLINLIDSNTFSSEDVGTIMRLRAQIEIALS